MCQEYDLIVIGSGPGGYVAAIRAAQLGMQVAVIEQEALGGVCLNWGCIPTKALLKSAQVFDYCNHATAYGIEVIKARPNFQAIIERSRDVSAIMSKGIHHLFKKHKITILEGRGKLLPAGTVSVTISAGATHFYRAPHIILATGARSRQLPHLSIDRSHIIGYREALSRTTQPNSIVIVGGGAIGCEFAYFYHTIGTKVTLVEYNSSLLPLEDEEISKYILKSFTKKGIQVYTASEVTKVDRLKSGTVAHITAPSGDLQVESELVLSAIGVQPNVENIGLEENGVLMEADKIAVDGYYKTSCNGVYAIGDLVKGPALAHVASAEGIVCVEKIAGLTPDPLDYNNLPSCIYIQPEVASVGYTEKSAKEAGYKVKVGVFPFSASGKARAAGLSEGFVKVIFDAQYGEWLGAHMVGAHVTEMIAEVVVARKLETTAHEIQNSTHPHPTMSEAIVEAVFAAYGASIHL
ncbi:Dihydrolipoyl dehydrogenase [Cardinium endosymbiont cEper1 of Encarsia pergandiella]|uniref:dihydrolipoyl dehydrogenase n=1 Tax=Cardinium endosymbiont of Encarsia pergandiella TaxID=249402 RepID=UPI00027EA698|nr:dihydrolipoyl dehydrogenase [Cardinium endosymbiont of Encarsia pergandiella]CCM10358.1 Dihydrolipoyl dehydrogenase [Cardinium endosymbiont cEper1 of Encarsia pergandiella]